MSRSGGSVPRDDRAMMVLLDAPHPPAGATTLIVSLGILTLPPHLAAIELAVALLALQVM